MQEPLVWGWISRKSVEKAIDRCRMMLTHMEKNIADKWDIVQVANEVRRKLETGRSDSRHSQSDILLTQEVFDWVMDRLKEVEDSQNEPWFKNSRWSWHMVKPIRQIRDRLESWLIH